MGLAKRRKGCRPWGDEPFVGIQKRLLQSPVVAGLSPFACKLLFDLLAQYHGANNGDLTAAFSVLRPRGWRSKATLAKAITELVESGVVERVREGGRRRAALYALTFLNLDPCKGKHTLRPTETPRNLWLRNEPLRLPVPLRSPVAQLAGPKAA